MHYVCVSGAEGRSQHLVPSNSSVLIFIRYDGRIEMSRWYEQEVHSYRSPSSLKKVSDRINLPCEVQFCVAFTKGLYLSTFYLLSQRLSTVRKEINIQWCSNCDEYVVCPNACGWSIEARVTRIMQQFITLLMWIIYTFIGNTATRSGSR